MIPQMKKRHRSAKIETLEPLMLLSAGVTDVEAFHRDGQTFLTWQEDTELEGEQYHVYRHAEQITADNLSDAELLTDRWGPLNDQTSRHQLASDGAPQNFVVNDLDGALSDDTGLFVYTTQDNESGPAWYAVQLVVNGLPSSDLTSLGTTTAAVIEQVDDTTPVLVRSVNEGRGQLFTHFMDYRDWNPTFQGYAYNYTVALPADYAPTQSYALQVNLHAYNEGARLLPQSEFDWQNIQLFVDDPGRDRGTTHSWWYGFAADHNYQLDGSIPGAGVVENFTQQRVLQAVDEVIMNAEFNVDPTRIHAIGHSMGASGALSFGIHYGNVFSGIYASQAMTDYRSSPLFQDEFAQLWGRPDDNLLIAIDGSYSEPIRQYAVGSEATGIWDWLDHGEQLVRRRGEQISFLMFGHGKDDQVIDWQTQGRDFLVDVTEANVAFTSEQRGDWAHNWMGFEFAPHSLFSEGFPDLGRWKFHADGSQIAFSNASGSGNLRPDFSGSDRYNLDLDWATTENAWGELIDESTDRFAVSLRSLTSDQIVDVTPRNLQQLSLKAGDTVEWQNVSRTSGQTIQSGTGVVDADGLLTLTGVEVFSGEGSRLSLVRTMTSAPTEPSTPVTPPVPPTPPMSSDDESEPEAMEPDEPAPAPSVPADSDDSSDVGDGSSPPLGRQKFVATADTVLTSTESQSANTGGMDVISVYNTDGGGERLALLSFDLSELTLSDNQRVTLELHQVEGDWDNGPAEISAFAVGSDWQEGAGLDVYGTAAGASFVSDGLTGRWENGPVSTQVDPGLVGSVIVDTYDVDSSVVRIDVTELVRAWQDGRIENHGLGLRITSGLWNEYLFASRDHADDSQRPSLVVSGPASDSDTDSEEPQALPAPSAETVRRSATQDTVLGDSEHPDANVGSAETLSVYATDGGGGRTAVLQFDVDDVEPDSLQSAFLELTQLGGRFDVEPVDVAVYALTQAWKEGQGTDPWRVGDGATARSTGLGNAWNVRGGDIDLQSDFGNGANGIVDVQRIEGYQADDAVARFDILPLLDAWTRGTLPNHGLAIRISRGVWAEYLFASMEHPDESLRPSIVLQ